ncbi:unnamed protein product [Arctogadus glacialis]
MSLSLQGPGIGNTFPAVLSIHQRVTCLHQITVIHTLELILYIFGHPLVIRLLPSPYKGCFFWKVAQHWWSRYYNLHS